MPAKRTAQSKAPAAKRTKTSCDPLENNFQKVLSAITDPEAVIPCREMFMEVAETALKVEKKERHDNQIMVLNMMREVFEAEKTRWAERIDEAQSIHDAAEQERIAMTAEKDGEDAKVKEQKGVLKETRAACSKAEDTVKECEEELATARVAEGTATEAQQAIITERENVLGVKDSLDILKEGSCDIPKDVKKHLASVTSLFKTLEVEEALVKTLPQVFGRKPEERGSFDEVSVKQMDEYIANHLTALDSKIDAAGIDVSDADVAITAWDAVVEVTQDKLGESKVAVEAEEAKLEELQTALTTARKNLKENGAAFKQKLSNLATEQVGLQKTEEVLTALEFLSEYQAPEPEPELPEPEVLEAKDMPSDDVVADMPSPSRSNIAGELHAEAITA